MQGVYRHDADGRGGGRLTGSRAPPLPLATLLTFPLFHVGGLQSFLLPYTAAGGKVVLMYRWDAERGGRASSSASSVTTIAGVPTTMFQLLEAAKAKGATLESLAGISSGATLVPPELVRRIDEQLVVAGRAGQRLRPDRDVGRGHRQLRPRLRRQPGERRQADLAGHRA